MNASLYFCHFSISCCWNSVVIGPSSLVMHFPAISNVQHAITDLPSEPILWTIFLLQKLQWRATINHKLVQNKHKWRCPFYSHRYTFQEIISQIGSFCRITQEDIVIFDNCHKRLRGVCCHIVLFTQNLLSPPIIRVQIAWHAPFRHNKHGFINNFFRKGKKKNSQFSYLPGIYALMSWLNSGDHFSNL